jgi:hypothetical protein
VILSAAWLTFCLTANHGDRGQSEGPRLQRLTPVDELQARIAAACDTRCKKFRYRSLSF